MLTSAQALERDHVLIIFLSHSGLHNHGIDSATRANPSSSHLIILETKPDIGFFGTKAEPVAFSE